MKNTKNRRAAKSASVATLISKINEEYHRNRPTSLNSAAAIEAWREATDRITGLIAKIREAGNDVKFDYVSGEYFAKFDKDGNEVFVAYLKATSVFRYTGIAETVMDANLDAHAAWLDNELEQIDSMATQSTTVI